MDPPFVGCIDYRNNFNVDNEFVLSSNSFEYPLPSYQNDEFVSFLDTNLSNSSFESLYPNSGVFLPPPNASQDGKSLSGSTDFSSEGQSPSSSGGGDFFEPVLRYINQMLMEETMEENECISYDPLALQETEKSLYEVLGKDYPPSTCQPHHYLNKQVGSPASHFSFNSSDFCGSVGFSSSCSNSPDCRWLADAGCHAFSQLQALGSSNFVSQSALPSNVQLSFSNPRSCTASSDSFLTSSVDPFHVQNPLGNKKSVSLPKKGLQEASYFPPHSGSLIIDFGKNALAARQDGVVSRVESLSPNDDTNNTSNGLRGRKNHEREDINPEEGRSNKQLASSVEEGELSEMFDKVLLCSEDIKYTINGVEQNGLSKTTSPSGQPTGSRGRKKKQGKKKDAVDLRTLLVLCAQAISADDRRTSSELLKQIRQHCNPLGDASQRLAYYFANALEARLDGTTTETQDFYTSQTIKSSTPIDAMRAFHCYITASPYRKFAIFFASKMILRAAAKAKTLHIIDFGILDGFHWPILIQDLSSRPGGPPKLRITGIELPQSGFRPNERIEKTGRRLAKYCDHFKVPFEYNGIASHKWETIPIEDFKIDRNEVLAVNCPLRFKNLLDESVEANSPRDAVLKLIKGMNPVIVAHSILNGSHNTPFFNTRFREALFHYSALFDMFDTIVSRESQERFRFESGFYGKDIMNIIACEGHERVERPETYKQWQARSLRAGFKPLPLDPELMKDFRTKLKASFHKDFVIDEDIDWMLLGWRGRILYASSCWAPAKVS